MHSRTPSCLIFGAAGNQCGCSALKHTRGEAFSIALNGSIITERPKAGKTLMHLMDRHLRAPHPVILGDLAGFKVEFRSTLPDTLIRYSLRTDYTAN